MWTPQLFEAAREVATLLEQHHLKLVLAESCTAGLAAAALGSVPRISAWFCGSAVVYRTEAKIAWLGVDPRRFDPPEPDSVGPQTSQSLANALLERTPEADVAAAITGHLGPNAPQQLDGRFYMSVRSRPGSLNDSQAVETDLMFQSVIDSATAGDRARTMRQEEATILLLRQIAIQLGR